MHILIFLALFQLSGSGSFVPGQGGLNGYAQNSPTISSVTQSSDATTVVLQWTTSIASNSLGSCGSEQSPDNNVGPPSTSHIVTVAGLAPSTAYSCTVRSGTTTSTISATTAALATSTPITSLSLGTFISYNASSPPHTMNGDTFYNTLSNDGINYFINADTTTGCNGAGISAATMLEKFTTLTPITCADVNAMSAYGPCCSTSTPDGLSPKGQGLLSMAGNLFMTLQRTNEANAPIQYQFAGSIIMSPDHGATWNNMQNPAVFHANAQEMTPPGISFFDYNDASAPPFNFSTNTFVMYGSDDGTLGQLVSANRVDNANAYIYLFSSGVGSGSGSAWNNSDSYYLARIPRSKLNRLNATDYQFYVSGDGTLDSSWAPNIGAAVPVLTNTGKLSICNVQYIPALNRYLLMTFNYPVPANAANSNWLGYEAPHPWGPWTLVYSNTFTGTGYYGEVILQSSALAATLPSPSMTLFFDPNYQAGNSMFYTTLTLNPPGTLTYVNTGFNEAGAGTNLAGTTPATCALTCVPPWTLSTGTDGKYQSGGGVLFSTPNPSNYDLIDIGQTDYTLRFHVSTLNSGTLGQVRLRFASAGNAIFVNLCNPSGCGGASSVGFQIFDVVGGSGTAICPNFSGVSTGDYTIVLSGSSLTVTAPGQAPATCATANLSGTTVGIGMDVGTGYEPTSLSVKSN
jgi:hypothetical protein